MADVTEWFQTLLGTGLPSRDIGVWQMVLRAIMVYVVTLAMVRLGKKRFMGKATAFDVILGIMLGSIASRAITGNAPMIPALGATGALIALHFLLSSAACRWHGLGTMLKGKPRVIVRDGETQQRAMRAAHLTSHDLAEDARRHGLTDIGEIAEARLERNGDISIIKAKRDPTIVTVSVADGVQTLRIEIP